MPVQKKAFNGSSAFFLSRHFEAIGRLCSTESEKKGLDSTKPIATVESLEWLQNRMAVELHGNLDFDTVLVDALRVECRGEEELSLEPPQANKMKASVPLPHAE